MLFVASVPARIPPASVAIVSRNSATARSLQAYFRLHDVDVRSSGPPVLVLPDEFPERSARDGIRKLSQRMPPTLIVVVTQHPARFEALKSWEGSAQQNRVLVMPRPVWGWALLEQVLE